MYGLKISAAVLCVLSVVGANRANATEDNWVNFTSSAHEDYVISFSHPPEWKTTDSLPHKVQLKIGDLQTNISGITAQAEFAIVWSPLQWKPMPTVIPWPFAIPVRVKDVPPEIMEALTSGTATSDQLDRIIPKEGCGWLRAQGPDSCVEFKRTPTRISNNHGLLIEYARNKIYNPSENKVVDPKHPGEFSVYFTPFKGRMALWILFNFRLDLKHLWPSDGKLTDPIVKKLFEYQYKSSAFAPLYQELLPTVLKVLRSAKFIPVSKLDKNVVIQKVFRSRRIRISERRDYHAISSFSLRLPSNWQAQEIEAAPADRNRERGRLIVDFTAPAEASSVGEREALYVVLDGMGLSPHLPPEYLATADVLAGKLTSEFKKLRSEFADIGNLGFLANLKSNYATGTGQTQVNTYAGKDGDGNDLKIRIYTAGGVTMVANIIYVADAEDYEALLPAVETIMSTINVNFWSTGLFR